MERDFAEVVSIEIPDNCLLISVGLPGSWKSPVTEEIARRKGFEILRSDMIRLEVLRGEDIFNNKVASDLEKRKRVYDEMFRRAEKILGISNKGLILDATFFKKELRSKAAEIAMKADRPFVIVECICSEERSIERILKRTKENYESNALTREAYLNNKAIFQPVNLNDIKVEFKELPITHIKIDTESDLSSEWKVIYFRKNIV